MSNLSYEERKEFAKVKQTKVMAALKILGLKAKKYEEWMVNECPVSTYQELWVRTNNTKKDDQLEIRVSNVKATQDISLSKDKFKSLEINISANKTAEQIANDIKRRLLETEQFKANENYLELRVKETNEYKNELESNKEFFEKSGFLFTDSKDKASHWTRNEDYNSYLDIKVSASSDLSYCSMELRGLTKDQWIKILKIIKPIIEESK